MSTLDNIMTGRNTMMRRNFLWQALYVGPARREELEHRAHVERVIDFLEIEAIRGFRSDGCPTGCRSGSSSAGRSPPSRTCSCSTSRWPA